MINKSTLKEVKNRLVKTYDPLAIYIFGSHAWGTPTPDSDLDLLIVVEKSNEKTYVRPVVGYHALFGLELPNDILVFTKKEFEKRSKDITTLCFKIKNEGKLLYAKS